jgi:hypothetical protein
MCLMKNFKLIINNFCIYQSVDVWKHEEAEPGDEGGDPHGLAANHGRHQLARVHVNDGETGSDLNNNH